MTQPRKKPREKYSLKPHEKREIAKLVGKVVNRQQLRGLATKYGVALKVIHEVLEHHQIQIDAAEPQSRPDPAKKTKRKPKLSLVTAPKPEPKTDPEQELLSRKLELDRREAELKRREDDLFEREKVLAQDRYEVDLILKEHDEGPTSEELEEKDRVIEDLRRRIEVLSSDRRHPDSETVPVLTLGQAKQALLVELADIKRDHFNDLNDRVPEGMMVM